MKLVYVTLISYLLLSGCLYAQENEYKDLIQFSGVIVTADSLKPVPFTSIIIKDSRRGTVSDFYGFFSFVAKEGDEIIFSSMGYKKAVFKIPDSLTQNRYSLIQIMTIDTILLHETVIYPWPTPEQFKEAFLKVEVPDDDLERAKKNLALAEMKEKLQDYPMAGSASMNYRNYIQQQTSKLYYAGQLPPNNLLNPIAWAQFIKAWREGKFKRKKE